MVIKLCVSKSIVLINGSVGSLFLSLFKWLYLLNKASKSSKSNKLFFFLSLFFTLSKLYKHKIIKIAGAKRKRKR